MEQGPNEREIIKAAIKRRQPLPDAIKGAPRLWPGSENTWHAFTELTTCRQLTGMGPPGMIPWTAVDRYAARHRLTDWAFDDLLVELREMDEAYLEHLAKKSEKPTET